jgi:ABC-2 type transport system ATP-binding protein
VSARASAAAPALRVRDLTKRYGDQEVLHGASFDVHPGELLAIVGPNGAGKTTLLSILAGIQRQSSGTISRRAGEMGWVPQLPALYSKLTVVENLELFAQLERVEHRHEAVAAMLDQTGLHARANERVERLSTGNRQRLNVAIGLISDPPILLLDEPSTALDPSQRERLWDFVASLTGRGRSVVFSSHIVAEVDHHADRVLVLDVGDQLFDGHPSQLPRDPGHDFEEALVALLGARGH